MKITNIYLTEPQRKRLKELKEQTDLTAAEHVRRAIDMYLESLSPVKAVEVAVGEKS